MENCGDCRMVLGILFAAIALFTGGAGIPALGQFITSYPEIRSIGVTAAGVTTALACIAALSVNLASEWVCCHVLRVRGCCHAAAASNARPTH